MLHIAERWGPARVAVTLTLMVTNLPEITHTQSVMLSWLYGAPKRCEVNRLLTPWLLHLAEQSLVPYTFMFWMS